MGGSAKQVRDKVAKETGYTGSDLDKAGQKVSKEATNVATEAKKGVTHNVNQVTEGT